MSERETRDFRRRWPRTTGLLELHQTKISLHRSSAEYSYPTVRLPHYLAKSLAGLPSRIYQTVYDGALAFLVVVCSGHRSTRRSEGTDQSEKSSRLYTAKIKDSNSFEPTLALVGGLILGVGALISVSGSDESGTLSTSRLSYAISLDGLFPRFFSDLHARYGTRTKISSHKAFWRWGSRCSAA